MNKPRAAWTLDREAFDGLLAALGPDREAASREYEEIRRRLILFFDWRESPAPEVQADETLDRIAKKLQAGEVVENVNAYARAVARHVLQEAERRRSRERAALDEVGRSAEVVAAPDDTNVRLPCLRLCIARLEPKDRALIRAYYQGRGRVYMGERRALAERLGLSYSGLKMRALRIRLQIEDCLRTCLADGKVRDR